MFGNRMLFLAGPRAIADVFVHNPYDFVKPSRVIAFLVTILGDGLLLAEGDAHRFQRKKIMPSFSFRHIKELYPIFWSKSLGLVDAVRAEMYEKEGQVEMNHLATLVTFDIIGLAGLGHDFKTLKSERDPLVAVYEELLETSGEKAAYFAANMLLGPKLVQWLPWKLNKTIRNDAKILRQGCDELVRTKKEHMKVAGEEHVDILSILLKSGDFSDSDLSDQLLTFLAAGYVAVPLPIKHTHTH